MQGPWVRVVKPPSSSERVEQGFAPVTRIHDDDAAQALGFQAGFVGGLTLLSVTTGAIAASFGHGWYERGTYSVRHKRPVYEGDVRVIWEEGEPDPGEERKIGFHLEERDGGTSTHGWAAVVPAGEKPSPPWERNPAEHASPGEDVLPEMSIGSTRPPFEASVSLQEAIVTLDGIDDDNWWHRYASPWGDPILTPYETAHMLYQGLRKSPPGPTRSSRLRTPMDAGTDLVFYHPLFADRTYIMKPRLVDKWQTAKSVFFCTEYVYEDQNGDVPAVMRAYSVHLIRALEPAAS